MKHLSHKQLLKRVREERKLYESKVAGKKPGLTIVLPLWGWILFFSAVAVVAIVIARLVVTPSQNTQPTLQIQPADAVPTLSIPPSGPLPTEMAPTNQTEMPCIKSDVIDLYQSDQSGITYVIMTLEIGTGAKFLLVGVGGTSIAEDISAIQNSYGLQPIVLKVGDTFSMTGLDIQYLGPSFGIRGEYCQ